MLYIPIQFDLIPILRSAGVADQPIRYALIKVAQRFTPILQKSAPVDTGRLKRSLRVEILLAEDGVALTSEVWYAGFVEFGTRRMRPRGYAASIVPDLISYGNELLRALLPDGVSGLGLPTRLQNNTDELNTGQTRGLVSQEAVKRVRNITVQPIRITPKIVAPVQVSTSTIKTKKVRQRKVEEPTIQPDYKKLDKLVKELSDIQKQWLLDSSDLTKLLAREQLIEAKAIAIMGKYRSQLLGTSAYTEAGAELMIGNLKFAGRISADQADEVRELLVDFIRITNQPPGFHLVKIFKDRGEADLDTGELELGDVFKGTSYPLPFVLYHEGGHFLEDTPNRILNHTFIASRGNRLVQINQLMPDIGYEDYEIVAYSPLLKPEQYYVQKYYGEPDEFKSRSRGWNEHPTEVLASGLQYYTSPRDMLAGYQADPELFKHTNEYLNRQRR